MHSPEITIVPALGKGPSRKLAKPAEISPEEVRDLLKCAFAARYPGKESLWNPSLRNLITADTYGSGSFDPLDSRDQAMDLVVFLGLSVSVFVQKGTTVVVHEALPAAIEELHTQGGEKATLLAITRAAAALGRLRQVI